MQTETAKVADEGAIGAQAGAAVPKNRDSGTEPNSAWLREFALRIDRIEREFSVLRMKLATLSDAAVTAAPAVAARD